MEHRTGFLFSGPFFTLKIVFVDLLLACCRLASEVNQGYVLFMTSKTQQYGVATFIVICIPGFIFAIHILSVYRREWFWYKTVILAISCVLFYPVFPILAILNFLWMKPSDRKINNQKSKKVFVKDMKDAQQSVILTQTVHGGIASPVQLCYQLWLAINGIILIPDDVFIFNTLKIKDWEGNELIIPIAAPVCIFFLTLT